MAACWSAFWPFLWYFGLEGYKNKKRPVEYQAVFIFFETMVLDVVKIHICKILRGTSVLTKTGLFFLLEILLVSFGNYFLPFFVNNVVHHLLHNLFEGGEVLLIEIDLVLFVMKGAVIVGEFLAFGD